MWGCRRPAPRAGERSPLPTYTDVSRDPRTFETSVGLLATFYAERGRWPKREAGEPEERRLASWLHGQRKRKDNLTAPHRALLDETVPGWDGSPRSAQMGTDDGRLPDWQLKAACLGAGADVFFVERGGAARERAAAAKAICATCSVRPECLEYGLSLPHPDRQYGIWGGLTEKERRRLHRERKASDRKPLGSDAAA